jgi:hypothetical protein
LGEAGGFEAHTGADEVVAPDGVISQLQATHLISRDDGIGLEPEI